MMCFSAADEAGQVMAGGGGSSTGALESPATGPIRLFTANRNRSEWGTYTAYAGSTEPSVTQITVERNTGSGVIASVANGYFVAWWPGDAYATRIIAYGPGGTILSEIGNNGWDFLDHDLQIIISIEMERSELNTAIPVKVSLLDPAGKEQGSTEAEYTFIADPEEASEPLIPIMTHLTLRVPGGVQGPGLYRIEAKVGSLTPKPWPVWVGPRPAPKPSNQTLTRPGKARVARRK